MVTFANSTATTTVVVPDMLVTTYLHMTHPSQFRPAYVNDPRVSIIPLNTSDVAFYRFLYSEVGRDWRWRDRLLMSDEELEAAISQPGVNVYVAYVDIEDLVGIAARLGPQAADQVLQAVATKLRECLVLPEIAARVGATTLGICLVERSDAQIEQRLRGFIQDCASVSIAAVADPVTARLAIGCSRLDKRLDNTLAAVQSALKTAAERDPPLVLR